MEYKNSYIFLKRNDKEKEIPKKDNTIVIKLSPSFKSLLKKTFRNIKFDYKDSEDINSGKFTLEKGNKEIEILFKYYSVMGNYYLDIIVKNKNVMSAVSVLNEINDILFAKNNFFDEFYVSIISYDYSSEYYCNKLYPYLNEFERKLRKLLFNIYTLNFNLDYYSAIPNEEVKNNIKKGSKEINKELNKLNNGNVSVEDCLIKYGFYSLEYSDIDKLLFTKYISPDDETKLEEFLKNNKDLTKLSDRVLRKKFELSKPKNAWERFFNNKKMDDNFQEIFNLIRIFRNNIDHCKFMSKKQHDECIKLLKQEIKSLDTAISITEEKDFFNRNIELSLESVNRISKMVSEIVMSSYKPLMDGIELMTQPMKELSEKMKSILNPMSSILSNMPSMVLPEVELLKYNIPNYFNDIETEDDDKKSNKQ